MKHRLHWVQFLYRLGCALVVCGLLAPSLPAAGMTPSSSDDWSYQPRIDSLALAPAVAPALAPDAALAIGQGVLAGEIFDDSTGLPLADVAVALVSLDGIPSPPPAPTALTDARGRYRLPSAAGLARLQITKPGFTAAERVVQAVAGARVSPLDARLTPLDPNATVITGILGGTATDASGERVLFVPPARWPATRRSRSHPWTDRA